MATAASVICLTESSARFVVQSVPAASALATHILHPTTGLADKWGPAAESHTLAAGAGKARHALEYALTTVPNPVLRCTSEVLKLRLRNNRTGDAVLTDGLRTAATVDADVRVNTMLGEIADLGHVPLRRSDWSAATAGETPPHAACVYYYTITEQPVCGTWQHKR